MTHALLNDLFQRIVTRNKSEQRKSLTRQLSAFKIRQDDKVLDFGCGTALFAPVFIKAGLEYHGYDIDDRLLSYASHIYRQAHYYSSRDKLKAIAPFDLIMANCCFHHIDTKQLEVELLGIHEMLADNGVFLMIDLLLPVNDTNILRKLFRKLEKGAFIRQADDYQDIVKCHFQITDRHIERTHLFSLKGNPIYNDLLTLVCKKTKSPNSDLPERKT